MRLFMFINLTAINQSMILAELSIFLVLQITFFLSYLLDNPNNQLRQQGHRLIFGCQIIQQRLYKVQLKKTCQIFMKLAFRLPQFCFIINIMNQSQLATILSRIRSISKQCNMTVITQISPQNENEINVQGYLKVLDSIRGQLIKYRQLQDQYNRLESILQKVEANLRQKTGFEQQIKLYNDSLKSQIQEIQAQKLQLLQNSKKIIKQLKKMNEQLFFKLKANISKSNEKGSKNDTNQFKGSKTDRVHSLGSKTANSKDLNLNLKPQLEDQIKYIVKTEYIERQQANKSTKKEIGFISEQFTEGNYQKKLLILENENKGLGGKTDRQLRVSKKRHKNIYSNSDLFNLIRSNRRQQQKQLKMTYLPRSPQKKGENKKARNKLKNLNRSLWKDKLAHKSLHSIASMQPVISNKETA